MLNTDKNFKNFDNTEYLGLYELKKYSVEDKEILVNENFAKLSAYLSGGIISKQLSDPSFLNNLANGKKYIIPHNASGEWEQKTPGTIALALGGQWHYLLPQDGTLFWVIDEMTLYVYNKNNWHKITTIRN